MSAETVDGTLEADLNDAHEGADSRRVPASWSCSPATVPRLWDRPDEIAEHVTRALASRARALGMQRTQMYREMTRLEVRASGAKPNDVC